MTEILARSVESMVRAEDEIVLVFAGLWSLAQGWELPRREIPGRILATLLEVAGTKRTVAMPGWVYTYPRDRHYDPVRTRPETGLLAETLHHHPGCRRTLQPGQSFLALGPHGDDLITCRGGTGWGDDSGMAWFETKKTRVVMLGVTWEFCGLYHRAEEAAKVPYRYFKRFPGTIEIDGRDRRSTQETLFVRSRLVSTVTANPKIRAFLSGLPGVDNAPDCPFICASNTASEIITTCRDLLQNDPYAFVANQDDVVAWVENGRSDEIAALAENERPHGVTQ
ncbi:MAG: AAC(3) family N-acetyltransferase [Alphaproteobacteria bacterium]|nr:AAC(3) family N-acetyltransferase [Alphaproteobacteria bacterium]